MGRDGWGTKIEGLDDEEEEDDDDKDFCEAGMISSA